MEEMFRIGQVASIYGISLDTLRLYEKKGLLIPYVCENNRYRYYSASQLDTLELILNSKNAGMSLNDIAKILKAENLSFYLEMFQKQEEALEKKMKSLERAKRYARKKAEVMKRILNIQKENGLEQRVEYTEGEITLYLMDLKLLIKIGANSPQTEGMEELETWRLFRLEEGRAMEDFETAGFSFQESGKMSVLEKDFLRLYERGLVRRKKIKRGSKRISFLGTAKELEDFISRLKKEQYLPASDIYVKNCHTIIHSKEENQYFLEIYSE